MRKKSVDLYLGLFVLAGLAAIGFMILYFGGMSTRNRYKVTVFFDDVTGLIEEAPVRYRGVECGTVRRIAIDISRDTPDVKVKVVLSLDDDIVLRTGDEVRVKPVSFLGEMVVEIVPGPTDKPEWPRDGTAELVGTESIGILDPVAELVGPLPEVMENLKRLTAEDGPLTQTLDGLSYAVNESLPDVITDLRAAVGTITRETESLLKENREQIGQLIASISQTAKSSSGLMENLKRLTGEKGSLTETVEGARAAIDDFRRVAHALYPTVKKLKEGQGGLGGFIHDPTWYENFNKLLLALRKSKFLHLDEEYQKEQRLAKGKTRGPTVWVR